MDNITNKLIEFIFTQGPAYITLAVMFAIFYFHFIKLLMKIFETLSEKIEKMYEKLDDVHNEVKQCHEMRKD